MATATASNNYKKCPITGEQFIHPILLTKCGHTVERHVAFVNKECLICDTAYVWKDAITNYVIAGILDLKIDEGKITPAERRIVNGRKAFAERVISSLRLRKSAIIDRVSEALSTGKYENKPIGYILELKSFVFTSTVPLSTFVDILSQMLEEEGYAIETTEVIYGDNELASKNHIYFELTVK